MIKEHLPQINLLQILFSMVTVLFIFNINFKKMLLKDTNMGEIIQIKIFILFNFKVSV